MTPPPRVVKTTSGPCHAPYELSQTRSIPATCPTPKPTVPLLDQSTLLFHSVDTDLDPRFEAFPRGYPKQCKCSFPEIGCPIACFFCLDGVLFLNTDGRGAPPLWPTPQGGDAGSEGGPRENNPAILGSPRGCTPRVPGDSPGLPGLCNPNFWQSRINLYD